MATPGQWVPPLPAGYEARWDPNQRAYFFINHFDKSTTWQDPRFAPQAQKPQQHQHHAAAAQNKVDLMKLHEIKQSFPSAPEDVIKSLLEKHSNNMVKTTNELFHKGYKREAVSHPPPRKVDMLERLKAMFPTVDSGLVEDMLSSCGNDEKRAREQLESMGYSAKFPATHRNASATGGRTRSPARAQSPKRAPSPAKPKMSESEKQSLTRKLKNHFKTLEDSVVEMALQVCDYDEDRAKKVLDRMDTGGDSSPPPSVSRPSTSRPRSPSPTPIGPESLEPVTLFDDRPSTTSSTGKSSPSRGSTPGMKKSSDSASRPSTGKSSSRTPSPKKSTTTTTTTHQTQQHRAKQVTQMSKDVLSSTIATLNRITNNVNCCKQPELPKEGESANQEAAHDNQSADALQSHDEGTSNESSGGQSQSVVSRQPQARPVHVSQYRTEAKGPDPSLRVGPNKGLLLSEYTSAKGPNPELRQGPDRSRVQGSQGAMGPDRSLHCGPQLNLRNGPNNENLLVTTI